MVERTRIPVVTVPAVSSLLCTLDFVKMSWGLTGTDDDEFLNSLIESVSNEIETYCMRSFGLATYTETIFLDRDHFPYSVPGGTHPLQMLYWPIVSVTSIVEGSANPTTLDAAVPDYMINAKPGHLVRLGSNGLPVLWPADKIVVVYVSGYTLPFGLTATTIAFDSTTGRITDSARGFSTLRAGGTITVTGSAHNSGPWLIDTVNAGYLVLKEPDGSAASLTTEAVGTSVTVSATGTLPAGIRDAAMREVGTRWAERDRDWFINKQSMAGLGDVEYLAPGSAGALSPETLAKLAPYRVPVVG